MNPLQTALLWYKERKAAQAMAAKARAIKMAEERVQLREFENRIYITLDGTPLVAASSRAEEAIPALEEARKTFLTYITRK